MSKNIVDKLLENENSLNLVGEESEITILFSDIRGFTSMSEKLSPKQIVKLLNKYFQLIDCKLLPQRIYIFFYFYRKIINC